MIHVYYKLRKIIVADVVPTSTGKEGKVKKAKPPEAAGFCQNFKSTSCKRRKHPFSLANT